MKILIFTDLHFGSKIENKNKEGINSHGHIIKPQLKKLKKIILKENPDFVVNLGDTVTAFSHQAAIKIFTEYLNIFNLPMPLYHLHGNHDLIQLTEEELNDLVRQDRNISFIHDGLSHIFVRAIKNREEHLIHVDKETIGWLEKELGKAKGKVVIYMHYPISGDKGNLGYYHKERPQQAFIQESKELRDVLEKSGKVLCVLSGHTHFYFNKKINGIRYITVPSFSEDKDGKPSTEFVIIELPEMDVEVKSLASYKPHHS